MREREFSLTIFWIHTHTHTFHNDLIPVSHKKIQLGLHITLPQKKIKQKITLSLWKEYFFHY